MGTYINTFIDTLLAVLLLGNSSAFTEILIGIVRITIISILILITTYERYRYMVPTSIHWITTNNKNLAIFMVSIFVLPTSLMKIG